MRKVFPSTGGMVPQLRSPWLDSCALPTSCYKGHRTFQPWISLSWLWCLSVGMVLHVVLVILSLLPLLEAQNPEHANITGTAITNNTLIWVSTCPGPDSEHCT